MIKLQTSGCFASKKQGFFNRMNIGKCSVSRVPWAGWSALHWSLPRVDPCPPVLCSARPEQPMPSPKSYQKENAACTTSDPAAGIARRWIQTHSRARTWVPSGDGCTSGVSALEINSKILSENHAWFYYHFVDSQQQELSIFMNSSDSYFKNNKCCYYYWNEFLYYVLSDCNCLLPPAQEPPKE